MTRGKQKEMEILWQANRIKTFQGPLDMRLCIISAIAFCTAYVAFERIGDLITLQQLDCTVIPLSTQLRYIRITCHGCIPPPEFAAFSARCSG